MILVRSKDIKKNIVVITGLTASSKSNLAYKLAKKYDGEIVNADSAQVYKEIPIISDQPSTIQQKRIKHHIYGSIRLSKGYSVDKWLSDCHKAIDEILDDNKLPIICGGTGLYINSLLYGLDRMPATDPKVLASLQDLSLVQLRNMYEAILAKLDNSLKINFDFKLLDKQRLLRALCVYLQTSRLIDSYQHNGIGSSCGYNFLVYVFIPKREIIREKIRRRCNEIFSQGGIDEAFEVYKSMERNEISFDKIRIIGLKQLVDYHRSETTLLQACEDIIVKTNQYAKRQSTWFRLQINYGKNCYQYLELADSERNNSEINSQLERFIL